MKKTEEFFEDNILNEYAATETDPASSDSDDSKQQFIEYC